MRSIFQLHKRIPGKIAALVAFSFFVSGCYTGNEPATVAQADVKKEDADRISAEIPRNITYPKIRPFERTFTKKDGKGLGAFSSHESTNHDITSYRDPFSLPALLQKQHSTQSVRQKTVVQAVLPDSPEPCVTGIFDNGKEKFALIRWRQVHGVFRCGEHLGNGYYVKNITDVTVQLCPEQNHNDADAVKLTLH